MKGRLLVVWLVVALLTTTLVSPISARGVTIVDPAATVQSWSTLPVGRIVIGQDAGSIPLSDCQGTTTCNG